MKPLLSFLSDLRDHAGAIWIENNSIKTFVPKEFQNEDTKSFISGNRNEIIELLNGNRIFSKDKFLNTPILRDASIRNYPLSFSQERMWFIEQYEGGTNAYHIPLLYELLPGTEKEGVKYALRQILDRHEVLRSTIDGASGVGVQVVHDSIPEIGEYVISEQEDIHAVIKAAIDRTFDLSNEYPIRLEFYREESFGRTFLFINMHHIASDGWSIDVFKKEFDFYYQAYVKKDKMAVLPALEVQYTDYSIWQRNYLRQTVLERQLGYWREKLSGYQPLELPTDYARPAEIDYRGDAQEFVLDADVSGRLRAVAKRAGVTLHSLLLSGVGILFNKYTGQDDIVIGSPIANRHHRQTEGLIGFFANTQVNRILLKRTETFEELIKRVYEDQVETQYHQDLPFERLVDAMGVERDSSRHPVFQVLFGVQRFADERRTAKALNFLRYVRVSDLHEVSQFDLSIFIDDEGEEIIGQVSYAVALFSRERVLKLIDHFQHLLSVLAEDERIQYSGIGLLSGQEREIILGKWNQTKQTRPVGETVHEVFERQVDETPGSIALVYGDQELTYRELNERSNQLARYIRKVYKERTQQEVKADTLIALYLERGVEMVVGILAVMKAGGAYVPMDTNYPQERIDFVLRDTQTSLLLTQRTLHKNGLRLPEENIVFIDGDEPFYAEENRGNLLLETGAKDLAYVIYTSGTTGKPKGVMIEHAACLNTLFALFGVYDEKRVRKATAFTSFTFDVSVSELFACLLQGIELHILSNAARGDSGILSDYLIGKRIQLVYLPPAILAQLPVKEYPELQTIIYAGESCDKHTARVWSDRVKLFNYYGPTEAAIYATGREILLDEVELIGRPISNTSAYILDGGLNPVPVGVVGELYLGGAGLARGYLNRADLTAERFIRNPFPTEEGLEMGYTRLYKTGDTVRWLADGNIEYVGRNDDQVKIRGYRIELGEIEQVLTGIEGIRQSCVIVREKDTASGFMKYLVGYYVADERANAITEEFILATLRRLLPEYMIPDKIVPIGLFPLTLSGKLDKRALPEVDFADKNLYIEPRSEQEKAVCAIWQDLLKIKQIGIGDNFFKIGGNSILAMQVSNHMNRSLHANLKVADLFKHPTISTILSYMHTQNSPIYVEGEL